MSFFLLYVFIVLVFWRPQEWLFPWLFGIPLLQGITYMALLAMMMEYQSGRLRFNFKEPQFFLYAGLFFAGLMSHISWFYLEGLLNSWQNMFRLTFFGILLFACCNSVSHLRWICRAFVIIGLVMAIHAILMDVRGYGFTGQTPMMSWRPNVAHAVPRTRFFGIFDDPNDLGQFLVTAMPLCFVFFKSSNFLTVVLGSASCALLLRGFVTTFSRGSQVGLAATVGVAFVMLVFRKRYRLFLLLGLIGILFAVPFSSRFFGGDWERVNLWGQANWAFKTKPIFGVGLGMINEYLFKSKTVHNAYLHAYVELGVFGYFFWFMLLFLAFLGPLQARRALRHCEHPEGQWLYRFSLWGLAAVAGFAGSAFFLSRAFIFPLYFLTAMLGVVPCLAKGFVPEDSDDRLGLSIRDTCIIGVPASLLSILYIYVAIIILNMQR
jgi:putative inorganic carbon (hco3(-)) transporter